MTTAADIAKTISLIQLTQMLTSLAGIVYSAVQNGRDGVTPEELSAAFADKDAALTELAEAISKAKAQGR